MASVIVAGARAPFGKFGGAFKDLPAKSLGAYAIRAALDRAGVKGAEVDYVIMGQVLQAGAGQITARQAAIEAGVPQERGLHTGAPALCGDGGQGDALIVRRIQS